MVALTGLRPALGSDNIAQANERCRASRTAASRRARASDSRSACAAPADGCCICRRWDSGHGCRRARDSERHVDRSVPCGGQIAVAGHACRGSQLAIAFVRRGGVMMQEGGLLRFTNTSSAACRISGWPRVIAVTATGRRVHAVHSLQSMLFATYWLHIPPVPRLTLRKGTSGYAVLGSSATAIGRPAGWRCPTARRLLVSPPGSRRLTPLSGLLWTNHGYPPAYLPLCGHRPWVEPVRPRPPLSH
jgi:hypothetical protein